MKFVNLITDSTDTLPLANTPEVFGLHPNAEINFYSQSTLEIWNRLIELQPQTGEFFSREILPFLNNPTAWETFSLNPEKVHV